MIKISYRFLYVFSCIQIIAGGHVGPDEVDECTSATLIYKLVSRIVKKLYLNGIRLIFVDAMCAGTEERLP